mmetsp:Transcript_26505/g.68335  ORF Transcript_26505/g.68335 Transcript_26505/m.68335 type:complete len:203 (+) Transcript_26505:246-854(+)
MSYRGSSSKALRLHSCLLQAPLAEPLTSYTAAWLRQHSVCTKGTIRLWHRKCKQQSFPTLSCIHQPRKLALQPKRCSPLARLSGSQLLLTASMRRWSCKELKRARNVALHLWLLSLKRTYMGVHPHLRMSNPASHPGSTASQPQPPPVAWWAWPEQPVMSPLWRPFMRCACIQIIGAEELVVALSSFCCARSSARGFMTLAQ